MMNFSRALTFLISLVITVPAWAVSAGNSTTGFVDDASDTRDIIIAGSDVTISSICVSVSFAKSNDGSFVPSNTAPNSGTPYHNETEFVLTSPEGTSVTLISNDSNVEINPDPVESFNSGSTPFQGTISFDQTATDPVNVDPDLPQEGTFQPHPGTLIDFANENAAGTWEFFFEDDVGSDGLSFYSVELFVNEQCGEVAPPPSLSINAISVPASSTWSVLLLILTILAGATIALRRQF